jgi:hypothetical protein
MPDMLHKPIEQLTAADLDLLVANAQPETLQLEFKRELNLGRDADKKEVAKDVSGMANAAGGRIVVGIEERRDESTGRRLAAAIVPVTDRDLRERLSSSLSSAITPRVLVRLHAVDVPGGYCLVVEVPPSFSELHMVTAYGESRYHVRTETEVLRMQEPEVRRRYEEMLRLRTASAEKVNAALQQELPGRQNLRFTLLGVPLLAGESVFEPHSFDARAVLSSTGVGYDELLALVPFADGLQSLVPKDSAVATAAYVLRLRRDGVVHMGEPLDSERDRVQLLGLLIEYFRFTRVCRAVWKHSGVRGPADLVVRFMVPAGGKVNAGYPHPVPPPGLSLAAGSEVRILCRVENVQSDFGLPSAREVFRRLWQHMGEFTCDYFTPSGMLEPWVAERVGKS